MLLGGGGLFQHRTVARFVFQHVEGNVVWHTDIGTASVPEAIPEVESWFTTISTGTFLRRAAEDAVAALLTPYDSVFYVYRGLEWLRKGFSVGDTELGTWMGISKSDLQKFTRLANSETGVRHASSSGHRIRAGFDTISWIGGLIDAINGARARADPSFTPAPPSVVAEIVASAAPRLYP
jgi:hypothetical protein